MKKKTICLYLMILIGTLFSESRIKDICYFSGLETKQLIGHGLVIGLAGTGDGNSSQMTTQAIKNMMERFGVTIPMNKIKPNNVATVIVSATLAPYAKLGSKFDVTVSSVGDAKSLEGGVLLLTNLSSLEDDEVYAVAQGAVSIGGFNSTISRTKARKNFANVGRVPAGAILKKEVFSNVLFNGELLLNLQHSDFSTAQKVAVAINEKLDMNVATAEDATSVQIKVPERILERNLIEFIAQIETTTVEPEIAAKVVINERTGTIVAGGNVQVSQVAVSHGNLTIKVRSSELKLSVGGAEVTETFDDEEIKEESAKIMIIEAATVEELSRALNSIKVTPRDLISIFQSLKMAGALQAELIIM